MTARNITCKLLAITITLAAGWGSVAEAAPDKNTFPRDKFDYDAHIVQTMKKYVTSLNAESFLESDSKHFSVFKKSFDENIRRYLARLEKPSIGWISAQDPNDSKAHQLLKHASRKMMFQINKYNHDLMHFLRDRLNTSKNNADVTIGFRLLHYFIERGRPGDIRFILQHGADPHALNLKGELPLQHALKSWHPMENVKVLLSYADVNAQNKSGQTVLHHLTVKKEIAELLIAKGAKLNMRDKFGTTPLAYMTDEKVIALLRKHGAITRIGTGLRERAKHRMAEHIRFWCHNQVLSSTFYRLGHYVGAKHMLVDWLELSEKIQAEDYYTVSHRSDNRSGNEILADILRDIVKDENVVGTAPLGYVIDDMGVIVISTKDKLKRYKPVNFEKYLSDKTLNDAQRKTLEKILNPVVLNLELGSGSDRLPGLSKKMEVSIETKLIEGADGIIVLRHLSGKYRGPGIGALQLLAWQTCNKISIELKKEGGLRVTLEDE